MTTTKLLELLQSAGCHPDKIVKIRKAGPEQGCFRVQRAYFYRHGGTDELWGQKVAQALVKLELNAEVRDTSDDYATWPKTSYFTAIVKVNG